MGRGGGGLRQGNLLSLPSAIATLGKHPPALAFKLVIMAVAMAAEKEDSTSSRFQKISGLHVWCADKGEAQHRTPKPQPQTAGCWPAPGPHPLAGARQLSVLGTHTEKLMAMSGAAASRRGSPGALRRWAASSSGPAWQCSRVEQTVSLTRARAVGRSIHYDTIRVSIPIRVAQAT